MGNNFFDPNFKEDLDRVDGKAKVTGAAKYAAEHDIPGITYGVLVASTIAKGKITGMDTKSAERAPGVLAVISYLNSPKVPGYDAGSNPAKGPTQGQGLRVFNSNEIYFNGQPIALVIADTFERALHASRLVKAKYEKEKHQTKLEKNSTTAATPKNARHADYSRGDKAAFGEAAIKIEAEYVLPMEVHNPMELHSITVIWNGEDKVTVYDKTQGVKSTQRSIMQAFGLPEAAVQVYAPFVGGGFGSALRTWPHVIAALIGAKKVGKPLKVVLTRDQMFTMVGYRPRTEQKISLGATGDGKLISISHEAFAQTSSYEEFTEGTVNMSRFLYACPNVTTRYKVVPLDISTPTWMRGPGEATGAYALESAMDELSYALELDPLELRRRNYSETDPERNRPFSSKFLLDCYTMGAERIGWKNRNPKPRSIQEDGLLVGYGMGTGTFNASRGTASASAKLGADGTLLIQSAVSDSGPGTATAMTQLASEVLGLSTKKITFELGDSSLPPGPTQGGSTTTSTLGSAVHAVCSILKKKLGEMALATENLHLHDVKLEDLTFEGGGIVVTKDRSKKISYSDLLKGNNTPFLEVTQESKAEEQARNYSMYSYSVHFVKVQVHPATGVVRVTRAVTVADAGKIVSEKTAASQMIGGVVGGIGMALTEEGVIDHRFGRWVNNNLADYHVPVHADIPHIEVLFINKPDPIINPMGSKGLGEVAIIGFAAAVANAVYHATGKRIRELPITPDKLI